MAPNAAVNFQAMSSSDNLEETLDKLSDTKGLANFSETSGEDWTDVKHSERKKRDRLLKDNVLIGLMQKSDYEGFKRLFENLTIMAITIYAIYSMHMLPYEADKMTLVESCHLHPALHFLRLSTSGMFGTCCLTLYSIDACCLTFSVYCLLQCFAFAGNHEFLHGNAWKTKKYNNIVMQIVGIVCFESPKHERLVSHMVQCIHLYLLVRLVF